MRKKKMASVVLCQTTLLILCLISSISAGGEVVAKANITVFQGVSDPPVVHKDYVPDFQDVSDSSTFPKEYVAGFQSVADPPIVPVAVDVQLDISVDSPADDQAVSENLDLVFLIHTSNAVNKDTFTFYKQFLRDIVKDANIDSGNVRVSLVAYKKKPTVLFNLNKHTTKATLLNAIDNLKPPRAKDGNVAAALDMVRTKVLTEKTGDRLVDAPNVLILLTDAASKENLRTIDTAARAVRDAGTRIYAVGVGLTDANQLMRIAWLPTNVYRPNKFDDLAQVRDDIVKQEPALLQKDAPDVDRSLSVDNSNKVDLAIAYHLSTSTKVVDIETSFVTFLTQIIEKAQIDNGNVRIAFVPYSRKAQTTFNLSKYKTSAEIIREIKKIDRKDRAKRSSGANALKEIKTDIFTSKGGDRPDAPNAVILITDNKSSDDQKEFLEEAEKLKAAGVKIITVGIQSADPNELMTVASDPVEKNFILARTYSVLNSPNTVESLRNTIAALQESRTPPVPPAQRGTTTGLYF